MAGRRAVIVADLGKDSFATTNTAESHWAQAATFAAEILDALGAERVVFALDSNAVFIRGGDGRLADAATGKLIAQIPAALEPVRLNNRVRGSLAAAHVLASPDAAKRIEAARTLFRTRDSAALSALMAAAREPACRCGAGQKIRCPARTLVVAILCCGKHDAFRRAGRRSRENSQREAAAKTTTSTLRPSAEIRTSIVHSCRKLSTSCAGMSVTKAFTSRWYKRNCGAFETRGVSRA